jgi:hypothetical protein
MIKKFNNKLILKFVNFIFIYYVCCSLGSDPNSKVSFEHWRGV